MSFFLLAVSALLRRAIGAIDILVKEILSLWYGAATRNVLIDDLEVPSQVALGDVDLATALHIGLQDVVDWLVDAYFKFDRRHV